MTVAMTLKRHTEEPVTFFDFQTLCVHMCDFSEADVCMFMCLYSVQVHVHVYLCVYVHARDQLQE